jgi:hypothetical protein
MALSSSVSVADEKTPGARGLFLPSGVHKRGGSFHGAISPDDAASLTAIVGLWFPAAQFMLMAVIIRESG